MFKYLYLWIFIILNIFLPVLTRNATGSTRLTMLLQMAIQIILKLRISSDTISVEANQNIGHLRLSVLTTANIKELFLTVKQNQRILIKKKILIKIQLSLGILPQPMREKELVAPLVHPSKTGSMLEYVVILITQYVEHSAQNTGQLHKMFFPSRSNWMGIGPQSLSYNWNTVKDL